MKFITRLIYAENAVLFHCFIYIIVYSMKKVNRFFIFFSVFLLFFAFYSIFSYTKCMNP